MIRRLFLLSVLLLPLGGCAWAVRETTDQTIRDLSQHPFDIAPEPENVPARAASEAPDRGGIPSASRTDREGAPGSRPRAGLVASSSSGAGPPRKPPPVPEAAIDERTTSLMGSPRDEPGWHDAEIPLLEPIAEGPGAPLRDEQVKTVAYSPSQELQTRPAPRQRLDPQIPPNLPGAEAPRIALPRNPAARDQAIDRLYPELPPLPTEPSVLPGPGGKPYTLAEFQRIAAANSPTLRQAAADVEAARGALVQARTYPNPTVIYLVNPSNNNSTAGVQGGAVDQPIITGGKMKLGVAAAQKNLDNALLALKRARMDLATSVRNAYFTLLVDVETLVVTRSLAQFSDEIYRLQVGLQKGTQVAPYEPAGLRAQTFTNRLAYMQAIQSYMYDWKSLVAALGLPQIPLSEIAGRVDRAIPYYDFDDVRAHVLTHHTDVLTARNTVRIAQYGLKLSQVTGIIPDIDVYFSLEKDFALAPFGTYQTLALGLPLPIWNRNQGNIIAAQAALVRATEESHRVEVTLTNSLAMAYGNYRSNLYAMDYYRRYILPDLVRYYRGIYERRQIDPGSAFGDLVFAQQNLATNVNTYIGILGSLWSSVVGVADLLQTDDLYQMARPHELPSLPDFRQPPPPPQWACGHESLSASAGVVPVPEGVLAAADPPPPPPRLDPAPKRPRSPADDTYEGLTAWMGRWRATLTHPGARLNPYLGGSSPSGPAAAARPDSSEEGSHEG